MLEIIRRVNYAGAWPLALVVCIHSSAPVVASQQQGRQVTPAQQDKAAQGGQPLNPPDKSLTVADYIKQGVPAPDRAWAGADMTAAQTALTAVAAKDSTKLPRYGSQRSGQVYARLIATKENLAQAKDKSLPLTARFNDALQELAAGNEITKLYLASYLKKQTGGADLLELLGGTLRTTVVVFDLANEVVASFDKTDPNYKTRMDGFGQMKKGLAQTVTGSLQSLTEPYDLPDRLRLLGYVQATLPALVPNLTPESRQETLVKINNMVSDPNLQGLQAGLKSLHTNVQKAVDKAKTP